MADPTGLPKKVKICADSEQKQPLLSKEPSSNAEEQALCNMSLLELQKWIETVDTQQSIQYDQMMANYDRMLTKRKVYELNLEKLRTENARFKFTSQCLMVKINKLTSNCDVGKAADESQDDVSKDKDDDATAEHMEVCSNTLIIEVSTYKEHVEMTSVELEDINDRLDQSAKMQTCLKSCVDELTVLASSERMRRDRDALELRTTINQLTAELDEVRRVTDQFQSVRDVKSAELAQLESAHNERNAMLRADNVRLVADLMTNVSATTTLQSEVFKADAACPPQLHQRDSLPDEDSSASQMLYQCNLSRADDDPLLSYSDLGRGDDQSIPATLSAKDCTATADDDDDDDDDDRRLSCSRSTAVQDVAADTTSDQLTDSRLGDILKKYGSKQVLQ